MQVSVRPFSRNAAPFFYALQALASAHAATFELEAIDSSKCLRWHISGPVDESAPEAASAAQVGASQRATFNTFLYSARLSMTIGQCRSTQITEAISPSSCGSMSRGFPSIFRSSRLIEAWVPSTMAHAEHNGAKSLYLLSNTVLAPAIPLDERVGFTAIARDQHPVYSRCNIVMERAL